jgi:DNA-directed RNA polymerase subunit E'/Rpb7
MDDIFVKTLLRDKIRVRPNNLTENIKQLLTEILREKYEGKCSQHGYIKPGSIRVDKCSAGYIQSFSLNGDVIYTVSYFAEICNPAINMIIACKVVNMNKFGILAEAYIQSKKTTVPVLEVIVAKNMVNIENDVSLDNLNVGDMIFVQVIGRKYELNDKKISIVGRTVSGPELQTDVKEKESVLDDEGLEEVDEDVIETDSDDGEDKSEKSDNEDTDEDAESDQDDLESEVDFEGSDALTDLGDDVDAESI